ncbi:hypothetical protein K7432_018022 [Basidiobolus ranarum]|uniref:Uncharacterized protein n=1 Tax=Basidiobolus ranarum TaxID=34480 RepID=A0ABR2WCM9_9FUNG
MNNPTPEESPDNQPEEQSPPDQGQDEQNPSDEGGAVTDPTTITPDESLESPPENTPGQADEEQMGSEQGQSELSPSEDQQSSPLLSSAPGSLNIAQLHPDQALLDQVNGESSSNSNALSDSNQFDQAQIIDQTLYQTQPKTTYIQPAIRQRSGRYKKYRKYRHHYIRLGYLSGNRY